MKTDIKLNEKSFLYLQILFITFACLIPVGYILITNHIWEDFFITFKHSKNLAEGNGLVYHPGERVHGFTSVFNTLLPAIFYWLTGKTSYIPALWLFRIISIVLYVAAGLFIVKFLKNDKNTSNINLIFFVLYYLFVTKTIVFVSNGQEAGFFVFFVFLPLFICYKSILVNWKLIGVLWAGLMYTRPDGFVYIMAMSLALLFITNDNKKQVLNSLFKAGVVCAVIYLPWFIFTWFYYGSPVPHTVSAKSVYGIEVDKSILYILKGLIISAPKVFSLIFLPLYPYFGGWPYWLHLLAFLSGMFCTIYWLLPHLDRLGKYLSLFFFFMLLYLNLINSIGIIFPWYLTVMETLGVIILARGIYWFFKSIVGKEQVVLAASVIVNIIVLFALSSMLFSTTRQMELQQEIIENGNRMIIGKWLNQNASQGDTVFLEPLGYIGYFSNLKMLDFPGLVSPETVRVVKQHKSRHYSVIIDNLQPNWIVLRPNKLKDPRLAHAIDKYYLHVATFDVRNDVMAHKEIMGINYLLYDSEFLVFKQKQISEINKR